MEENENYNDARKLSGKFISDLKVIGFQKNNQVKTTQNSMDSHLILNQYIQSLVEIDSIRNKELNEIVSINKANNLSLDNIAKPNIADWIGVSSNIILALLGVYAAFKVKSAFDDRLDSKVYAEIEKFWKYCDDFTQDTKSYFLFFPFKLSEPVEEWCENDEVKNKVEKFLDFSEGQSEKMKIFLHVMNDLDRTINRLGWRIHPKAAKDFKALFTSIEYIYRSFGEYNCMTAQLFRIDRSYIGMTMFMGVEDMEWDQRFALVDRNLPQHIESIVRLKGEILNHIESLEDFNGRKKFVSKR